MKYLRVSLACLALIGCGRPTELEACNIANKSCQIDVYYALVRLRGDGYDTFEGLPPIRTVTVDQYRAELTDARPTSPPSDAFDPNAEPKRELDPWDVALSWFGLVTTEEPPPPAAAIDTRVNNVAAFYSSRTQQVTVIDRGQERNDRSDTTLLTHELVHAFQDNEVGLDISDPSSDGNFAGRAFTEGEAVLYEKLAGAEIDDVSPYSLLWDDYYAGWLGGLRQNLTQDPSPFYAVSWFVYPLGGALLTRGWVRGGNAAVRHIAGEIPQTALGYLAEFQHASFDRAEVPLDCSVAAPEERFARIGYDRFGAMHLYAFLEAAGMDEQVAFDLAFAWRDDLFYVYFDEARREVAASWRVRMQDPAAARLVADAAGRRPVLRVELQGSDAVVVASDVSVLAWRGAIDCAPTP